MDTLKRHLFSLVCGLVAAGSAALGVLGVNSMSKVTAEMQQATQLSSRLSQVGGGRDGPINKSAINAENQRLDKIRDYHGKVIAWATDHNRHQPLLADVFPHPDRDDKLSFRDAYARRLEELLEMLDAGMVASEQDIADAKVEISEEEKAEVRFGVDRSEAEASGEALLPEEEKPERYPSGLFTDYGAKLSPAARANIAGAHQFRCYAERYSIEVLGRINEGITPEVRDMWDAQISLWIQEDVIAALVRINDEQARQLEQAGQTPWVGNMPIKELISLRSSAPDGYVVEESPARRPAQPRGEDAAFPPSSGSVVFTQTVSGDLFEVVQFTLKMVVDARSLPTIVQEICRDNFHTLLRIAYDDMSKNPDSWAMTDKVYGSDPLVRVVLDFETIFLGALYRDLMPDQTRAELGLPEREEDDT